MLSTRDKHKGCVRLQERLIGPLLRTYLSWKVCLWVWRRIISNYLHHSVHSVSAAAPHSNHLHPRGIRFFRRQQQQKKTTTGKVKVTATRRTNNKGKNVLIEGCAKFAFSSQTQRRCVTEQIRTRARSGAITHAVLQVVGATVEWVRSYSSKRAWVISAEGE